MTTRSSTSAPILAALAIVVSLLAAYVAGYFWLGDRLDWVSPPEIQRSYPHEWQMHFFKPAGKVEAIFRRIDVRITCWALDPPLPDEP
jgi:hypothetical protein